MKFFVSVLLLLTPVIAMEYKPLNGTIRHLAFDSLLNSYVNCNFKNFYKLNKYHSIDFSYTFPYIWEILVNNDNDVFIFANFDGNPDGTNATTGSLWRMKSYSNDLELLFNYPILLSHLNYFIDKDDNIYLNTKDGVALFRSRKNTTVPVEVANLEGYVYDSHAEDQNGNIYLLSKNSNSIAIVTRSAKRKLLPEAVLYSVGDDSEITDLTSWNGDLIFVDRNSVRRLRWDLFEPVKNEEIISQYNTSYTLLNGQSNRLFIISKDETTELCQAHFLTLDDELVTTETTDGTLRCSIIDYRRNLFTFQKDGSGYFIYSDDYLYVLSLKHNETKFDYSYRFDEYISAVGTDDYDNVWIMTDNIYRGALFGIPAGSSNLTLVYESDLAATMRNFMMFRKETNEIFVAGEDGLYIFDNLLYNP